MAFIKFFLLSVILLGATNDGHAKKRDYGTLAPVIFHRCYDGDTCTFTLPGVHPLFGQAISIRLNGVDTPEMRGKCAQEKSLAKTAKIFVNDKLSQAKVIELRRVQRGKYFRIVADIWIDGEYLGQQLVKNNLGVLYGGGTKHNPWCAKEVSSSFEYLRGLVIDILEWILNHLRPHVDKGI